MVLFDTDSGYISPAPSANLTPVGSQSLPSHHQQSRQNSATLGQQQPHQHHHTDNGVLPHMSGSIPVRSSTHPSHQQAADPSLCGFSSDSEVDISETLTPHLTPGYLGEDIRQRLGQSACQHHTPQRAEEDKASTSDNESIFSTDEHHTTDEARSCQSGWEGEGVHASSQKSEEPSASTISWCTGGVEFRIVMEPNSVRQNPPKGGVPFDMVDQSQGGAIEALLARLEAAGFGEAG